MSGKRLRVYPWLIGATLWAAWGLELLLRRGWQGGLGHILWSDFVAQYGAGWLDRLRPAQIYNFQAQAEIQQASFGRPHSPA